MWVCSPPCKAPQASVGSVELAAGMGRWDGQAAPSIDVCTHQRRASCRHYARFGGCCHAGVPSAGLPASCPCNSPLRPTFRTCKQVTRTEGGGLKRTPSWHSFGTLEDTDTEEEGDGTSVVSSAVNGPQLPAILISFQFCSAVSSAVRYATSPPASALLALWPAPCIHVLAQAQPLHSAGMPCMHAAAGSIAYVCVYACQM